VLIPDSLEQSAGQTPNRVKAAPRGTRQLRLRCLSACLTTTLVTTSLLKHCTPHLSHRSSPNYPAQRQRLTINFSSSNRVLATIYAQDMSAIDWDIAPIWWDIAPHLWDIPVPPSGKPIHTYLPMELMREIFLYCIESDQIRSDQLAYVCRYWRSVITTLPRLWSTLRVGTWTERERVAIWLQRAHPKKIVIDTQRDRQLSSNALPLSALQDALAHTHQWHELTISTFPPENLASPLGFQVASPINVLKVLHVEAGCMHPPSFAHLLNLIPTEAPLCEMRLHSPFVSTHFLQPHWFPALRNLTVLVVNGRDMNEPFELLPTFTQLQIFEADRLHLPFYEPNTNLPLLYTLRKLQLRACSIQWMAGRHFPYLEECAILLPRHWGVIQQHEVQLPSCKKLAYHGYPMTTAQHFHIPKMREMDLRSHDCNEQRVYQHLRHLCRVNGRISNLTTLHLTFQCSEKALMNVVKYLILLQELALSITHPSPSFQTFLEALAAKPSTNEWPGWGSWEDYHEGWEQWCSSQTWHANVLPHLKYLEIQCPKGFSQSERLDNFPLLRAIGWTRAYLTPPLEHLKVWEGRGGMDDIAVDYTSTGYLDKHLGISSKEHDTTVVRAIVTRGLAIAFPDTPILAVYSTALFRQLRHLALKCKSSHRILILPYLEQIVNLQILGGSISDDSLTLDLPLTHTLQWLELGGSTSSWMLGRTFKALREFRVTLLGGIENRSSHEGLQVDLPACKTLELMYCSMDYLRFLSCSNVQILRWCLSEFQTTFDLAEFNLLHDFLFNLSCLQNLYIVAPPGLGIDSLIDFVFCGASEHGVWRDIRSVEVEIRFHSSSEVCRLFNQTVGHQPRYETWWKSFTVNTMDPYPVNMRSFTVTTPPTSVIINASM